MDERWAIVRWSRHGHGRRRCGPLSELYDQSAEEVEAISRYGFHDGHVGELVLFSSEAKAQAAIDAGEFCGTVAAPHTTEPLSAMKFRTVVSPRQYNAMKEVTYGTYWECLHAYAWAAMRWSERYVRIEHVFFEQFEREDGQQ